MWEVDPFGIAPARRTKIGDAVGGGKFESAAYNNQAGHDSELWITHRRKKRSWSLTEARDV